MHEIVDFSHGRPVLQIVDTDDLIDPSDKGGHLHVDSRNILSAASEAPGHQAGQLVESIVLANKGASAITLEERVVRNTHSIYYCA